MATSLTHQRSKECSLCGSNVARKDCHKNRYAQYICRPCQAAGGKAAWRLRLKQQANTVLRRSGWRLAAAGAVLVLVWLFFRVLDHVNS